MTDKVFTVFHHGLQISHKILNEMKICFTKSNSPHHPIQTNTFNIKISGKVTNITVVKNSYIQVNQYYIQWHLG